MINTGNTKEPEVAVILANAPPVDGWNLSWMISKLQIEYILHDIAAVPPSPDTPHIQRAQYRDFVLPVLSLEKYYGLNTTQHPGKPTYLVTKLPLQEGGISRAILKINNPVRIRKLNFNATQAQNTGLETHEDDILGAFTLPENQLVIVPDIAAILEKELHAQPN